MYQTTTQFITPNSTGFQEYSYLSDIPFSDFDTLVDVTGWCRRADGWYVQFCFGIGGAVWFYLDWNKSASKLYFYVFNDNPSTTNQPATLTFKYTKV